MTTSIRYLPFLDHDKWYVLNTNLAEQRKGWLSRRVSLQGPNTGASIEYALFQRGFGLGFTFGRNGGESDIGLDLYMGRVGSVWMRLRTPWTKWARVSPKRHPKDHYSPRHYGLELLPHHNCLIRGQWADRDGWTRGEPWWQDWSITKTTILGRVRSESIPEDSGSTVVPMPEGSYPATWQKITVTNHYVRFPGKLIDWIRGPRVHQYVDLEVAGGIPSEGKGENSWDCGMDGTFSVSGQTLSEAVGHFVSSVTRDRERYGGPHDLQRPTSVSELV